MLWKDPFLLVTVRRSVLFSRRRFLCSEPKNELLGDDIDSLEPFKHGRRGKERKDSVTVDILKERKRHRERFEKISIDNSLVHRLESMGFGSRRRLNIFSEPKGNPKSNTVGAGGFAVHLTSVAKNWPVFDHILPEIAFAGHTNCGKVTN